TLHPRQAGRLHFRRRLAQEVRRLQLAGIPVVSFQPSTEDRNVMGEGGLSAMSESKNAAVVEQVYATTLRRLARPEFARRLAVAGL
ncbi:MAG: hypothetical protein JHC94_07540, partial [Acidimicrobiia bacterium]|nr:hypothetical protein [Acidimicrobiia bacterium]